jgi:DNA polymerase-3 subunit delta'
MSMFSQIHGQDDAVAQLTRALEHRVNSYVFYGSRGTFVEEAAREFAARLIDPSGDSDSRVMQQRHADVIEFEPTGVSYRIKEDVRDSMLSECRKTAIEGASKVLIVHDAQSLRSDSANTLLKSLEEPPENTYWILIAPSPDHLIATIKSRCYEVQFARLGSDVIENVLVSEGVNESRAHDVALRCSGRLDRARKLAGPYAPLMSCAKDIVDALVTSERASARNAQRISETFDEISSDVIAKNKAEFDALKKDIKDSGYADRVAQSIVTAAKNRMESSEKRLRSDITAEFLEALYQEISMRAYETETALWSISACEVISDYRKRLVFNPSETLFFESLLASVSLPKFQVNS